MEKNAPLPKVCFSKLVNNDKKRFTRSAEAHSLLWQANWIWDHNWNCLSMNASGLTSQIGAKTNNTKAGLEIRCYKTFFSTLRLDAVRTDKLELTGQNLGRVFGSRCGRAYVWHSITLITKTAQLKVENSARTTFRLSPVHRLQSLNLVDISTLVYGHHCW